jgi:hypothetical protein
MLGTDPEFLIVDSRGKPVPAHKAGMPDKQHKLVLQPDESWCFRDGYMVEINLAPNQCRQTMGHRMARALRRLEAMLPPGHHLRSRSAVKINLAKDMKNAPDDVKQFGCEPSWDAYTGETKTPPIDAMTHPWRYAGGHLHFSGDTAVAQAKGKPTPELRKIVKLMDLYIGLPLTCVFGNKLTYQRRKFYGQAGEFRPQSYGHNAYGVEYRTPGPEVWRAPWVASFAMGVGRDICRQVTTLAFDDKIADDLQDAINTGAGKWKLVKGFRNHFTPLDVRRMAARAPKGLTAIMADDNYAAINNGFKDWLSAL